MRALSKEVYAIQNPALCAVLLWRFACAYNQHHPDRAHVPLLLFFIVLPMVSLNQWCRDNEVQYNVPNPKCNEAEFRRLYVDTDPSKFDPLVADEQEWMHIREWRKGMDAAVYRKNRK